MSARVPIMIPMPLRVFTGGSDQVEVEAATVGEALAALVSEHDALAERVLNSDGDLRTFVNVFVGSDNIRDREGLRTPLKPGDKLAIIPAVAGGARQRTRDCRLAELRAQVDEVTPAEAGRLMADGAVLIDVREQDEIAQGSPRGARRLGRSYLELRIEEAAPDLNQTVLVMCNGGTRSLLAAEDLLRMGYTDVRSVVGGFNRWKDENLPFEVPRSLNAAGRERYGRHLLMPEVGEAGQLKLLDSRVLIIGAGGKS